MRTGTGRAAVASLAIGALALVAGCGSGFSGDHSVKDSGSGTGPLSVLIGSSGPAETKAVKDAAAAYTKQSGVKVTVTAAQNLQQQLSQGFAANKPPDVFYLDPVSFQNYAKRGSLDAYAQNLPDANDFYPALRQSFTYHGTFYCVPKDWSTIALVVNTDDWARAGLTEADVPTTWDQLAQVAKKLTTPDTVGLAIDANHAGVDPFLYQNGGSLLNADATQASFDSASNIAALTAVKKMMAQGVLKFPADLDAGWTGEALGKKKAAMVMVGNWLDGAMHSDFPDVKYKVYPLPAGPGGHATVSFTNCWGIPKNSPNRAAAEKLVRFLSAGKQQMAFAKAFGVMPSRQSVRDQWTAQFPNDAAFLPDPGTAHPDLALPGGQEAISDFDSKLAQLASADPKALLAKAEKNFQAVIQQNG